MGTYHLDDRSTPALLVQELANLLTSPNLPGKDLLVVCIGTDRSTGDSLGPLVGTMLKSQSLPPGVKVWGTLDEPIHGSNLRDHLTRIEQWSRRPTVLAVDAGLGKKEHVGNISVRLGPLRPGKGVGKKLRAIGDLRLIGTVNFAGGTSEFVALQNTRLSLVVRLARTIATGISAAVTSTPADEVAVTI